MVQEKGFERISLQRPNNSLLHLRFHSTPKTFTVSLDPKVQGAYMIKNELHY